MKPVAILGCGPAGLLAAHAAGMAGKPIAIFSKPVKSFISGAQFLHRPILNLTSDSPDFEVTFKVQGNAETYQRKVYKDNSVPFVSFGNVANDMRQSAWHMEGVYDRLWSELERNINEVEVTPEWLQENINDFEAVVSTIPANVLCQGNHHFSAAQIKIWGESMLPIYEDNVVHYDGTKDRSWYRCSSIQGKRSTEWGFHYDPPIGEELRVIRKPIGHNCDCFPEIIRVGRYGKWKKGILIDDAFYSTLKEMHERGIVDLTKIPS